MTNLTLWMLHSVPDRLETQLDGKFNSLNTKFDDMALFVSTGYRWISFTKGQSWWRHQMETFSALLAICAGNSPASGKSPHKGQWRGALMFSLICAWINGWGNNDEGGDLRRHRAHYDVIVMMRRFDACLVVSLKSDEEAVDLPVIETSWHVSDVTVMIGHSWWLCCNFTVPTTFRKFELKYNIWLSRTCENVFCRMAVIMIRFEYLMKRLLKS